MFWKKDKNIEIEKKLGMMNEVLKKSFANVKRDTANIFQWLNYLYRKNLEQERLVRQLQTELSYMPKTREDVRKIIDDYYSFESLVGRIRELGLKVEELSQRQPVVERVVQQAPRESIDFSHIEKRLEKLEQKKMSIKEKIIQRLTRNSKEYIKSTMLSYIRKYERISALQLKDIVVEEQRLCSKSSFYRLLEELEQLEEVGVIKQGKEKHYLAKFLQKM